MLPPQWSSRERQERAKVAAWNQQSDTSVNEFSMWALPAFTTVEPLSNDHPHQRQSLLYDHILCDGHCFLFVRSLTNDHPSDATNDRVRWDFLPRERPPRLQCISKNRGWRFNIRSQSCTITMLCLDTFQVIQLIWILFYFGDDATTTFSNRRCIVTMLPTRRRSDTFVVGLIQVLWTSRIRGEAIINGSATWCCM